MREFRPFIKKTNLSEMPEEDFCSPDVDIVDKDDELVIKIDLPGVNKEDIVLNVSPDAVEVKSEKTEEREESEENYYLSERFFKGFYRKIALPKAINPDDARAKLRNGVLEITAPKYEEESSSIEIEEE